MATLVVIYLLHFEVVLGLDWQWGDQRAVVWFAGGYSNLGFGPKGTFDVPQASLGSAGNAAVMALIQA